MDLVLYENYIHNVFHEIQVWFSENTGFINSQFMNGISYFEQEDYEEILQEFADVGEIRDIALLITMFQQDHLLSQEQMGAFIDVLMKYYTKQPIEKITSLEQLNRLERVIVPLSQLTTRDVNDQLDIVDFRDPRWRSLFLHFINHLRYFFKVFIYFVQQYYPLTIRSHSAPAAGGFWGMEENEQPVL